MTRAGDAPSPRSPALPPAAVLAVAAIFSVQFGNAFVGSLLERVGPLGAASLRLAFGAAILLAVVRPRVREWSPRMWAGAAVLGLGMAGMNVAIYFAIAEIPLGIAVTIELMGPLAVAAAGIRRPVDALWVLLALGGVLLFGFDLGGDVTIAGVAFAVLAAACWATYIVASSRLGALMRGAGGVDGLAVAMALGAVAVVPFGAGSATAAVAADPMLLLVFAGIAVLTSALPYSLEFLALKRMPTRAFGVLSSLGPAVAALAGFVVLGQALAPHQLLAIALVVAASAGVVARARG